MTTGNFQFKKGPAEFVQGNHVLQVGRNKSLRRGQQVWRAAHRTPSCGGRQCLLSLAGAPDGGRRRDKSQRH